MNLQPPQIYADWAKCFRLLKDESQDEEAILSVIHQGKIDWVPGVSSRFLKRLNEVIDDRFQKSANKLRQDLQRAQAKEHLLVPALIAERKRSEFVIRLVMMPAIPNEQKQKILEALNDAIKKLQKGLEDSARQNDSTGKLYNIINRNPVTVEIPQIPIEEEKKEPSFFTTLIKMLKKK
ncbi:hypothetical protein SAMN05444392_1213 [Seinonella peptonophila]|uniref:Uncharacterized protein n=1 Tax=Seinonella peptonophila TaxID=112248 RepID=A0A1M5BC63_9BACL|nr:hypothetical protein [Seinonella peptonophila]SHF40015.1 hypothetical protein SAMN05444392_1213 [Seinonella peptonophila]